MARARNLKPSFFTNDILAEIAPLGRILFQGLWCLADRAGRLEDRPKKIKAEVLPYDECDADAFLSELHEKGFILRYEMDGTRFIQVLAFTKHQNPHVKEAASSIPAPYEHSASTVQEEKIPEQAGLIPDSPLPITDSLLPIEDCAARFDALAYLESLCVDSIVARDWITHRKAKRAPPTQTAIDGINREAEKAGLSLQAALKISCQRGWQGFEAGWMKSAQGPPRAQSWSEKNDEVIAQLTGRSRGYEPDDRTIDI